VSTGRRFAGNALDAGGLQGDAMQAIAREFNPAEATSSTTLTVSRFG